MIYYLYILKSQNVERYYIGITGHINSRIQKHNNGSARSTKAYRPWACVYSETFQNKTDARKREIFLKKNYLARKELIKKIRGLVV